MKLTIVTGGDSLKRANYLQEKGNAINYHPYRLNRYPLHLPLIDDSIYTLCFNDVYKISALHRLAAICSDDGIVYKKTIPGVTCIRIDLDILISVKWDKKEIQHIFKGLSNVKWIQLK